jgi:hypothetical protein
VGFVANRNVIRSRDSMFCLPARILDIRQNYHMKINPTVSGNGVVNSRYLIQVKVQLRVLQNAVQLLDFLDHLNLYHSSFIFLPFSTWNIGPLSGFL